MAFKTSVEASTSHERYSAKPSWKSPKSRQCSLPLGTTYHSGARCAELGYISCIVYVCIIMCIHIYIYIYVHTSIVCVYIYIYTCICRHTHYNVCIYLSLSLSLCIHIYIYTHMYVCVCGVPRSSQR